MIRMLRSVLCLAPSLFLASLCFGAQSDDVAYLKGLKSAIVWKNGIPDPAQTSIKVDVKRVQSILLATREPGIRASAWTILAVVNEPSQLDFLLKYAKNNSDQNAWGGAWSLAGAIALQVRNAEDELKVFALKDNAKLRLGLIPSFKQTQNPKIIQWVLTPEHGDSDSLAWAVNDFIAWRLEHNLPIDEKRAGAVLMRSCLRKRVDDSNYASAALAASVVMHT